MEGDPVHLVVALLQHLTVPHEVRGHDRVARSARDEPHGRVHDADLARRVPGLAPVVACGHVAHLPGAVHLVAEAPVADAVGLLVAVLPAQVAPARALVDVAVLDVVDRHLRRAGAEVEPQQRLGADEPAPLDELVGAELVRLDRVPRPLEHGGALVLGPHAVEPVVAGDEVPAWIAHDGDAEPLHFRHHVPPESIAVGELRARLVDSGVDGASEVLQERP